MAYYLGVDQGTTNTKVILSSGKKVISKSTSVIPIRFTKEGWVEQDPSRMIKNIIWCTKDVINNSKIDVKKIASVGISNQTETFIVWDKSSGKPITPAISWQCKRSSNLLKKFNGNFNLKEINKKTGLNLDPTFTATKIFWLKKNYPEIYKKIVNNKYLIGTVDTWIIWNLTSGKIYSTDATNASRTLLCNINTIQWDKSLIDQFELKKISLPEIKKNRDNYGEISKKYFGAQIKINASIGDQQASLYGNNCLKKGDLKITLGTGGFLWLNRGYKFYPKNINECLDTLAWFIDRPVYASEGFIFMIGALLDYFTNNLKLAKNFKDLEKKALKSKKTDIYIVPSMLGMGTPWWNPKSKGAIYGLSTKTNNSDLCLSAFETVGFQIKAALEALKNHSKININKIQIDGKLSSSILIKKILFGLLGKNINFSNNTDSTAIGAALLSGNIKLDNSNKKRSFNFFSKNNEINKYLNNKYMLWKKLTNHVLKF